MGNRWPFGMGALLLVAACVSTSRPPHPQPKAAKPSPSASGDLCSQAAATSVAVPRLTPDLKKVALGDAWDDRIRKVPEGADACFVAQDNIERAKREASTVSRDEAAPKAAGAARDPLYFDLVDRHLHLTKRERAMLQRDGLVVLDRFEYTSYGLAYHEIFRQQLPVFVSIDSILHATYRSNATAISRTEERELSRALYQILTKLNKAIDVSPYSREVRQDLSTYVRGGLDLLLNRSVDGDAVRALASGEGLVTTKLFGRDRVVDRSRFEPRGNYVGAWTMRPEEPRSPPKDAYVEENDAGYREPKGPEIRSDDYFKALTWLSRIELNLVSRPCASSSPEGPHDDETTYREVRLAMALADLSDRSGVTSLVNNIDDAYAAFAGKREDIGVRGMLRLMKEAKTSPNDPKGPEKIMNAIGDRFPRRANTHFRNEMCPGIPQVMTMLGIRPVPDVEPLTSLVHANVPERKSSNFADIAYVLGHDVAAPWLVQKEAVYPDEVNKAREQIRRDNREGTSLYNRWLAAILALASHEEGTAPSFVKTLAYQHMRMNSALVGFGQIRHNYVAIAAQGYDQYGCDIPDGYVEPALGTIDSLLAYQRDEAALTGGNKAHDATLSMLRDIVMAERAGRRLSEPQRRFLAMVAEYISTQQLGDSGGPPKYSGWYFDMFSDRHHGALKYTGFVGDYFTHTASKQVNYLGAGSVRLGVFLVDTNGQPRVMVGPVSKGYFATTSLTEPRLDDTRAERATTKQAPWLTYVADREMISHEVPKPEHKWCGAPTRDVSPGSPFEQKVSISSHSGELSFRFAAPVSERFRRWTIQLLDHHGDAIGKAIEVLEGKIVEFRVEDVATRGAIEGVEYSFVDTATGERRFVRDEHVPRPVVFGSEPPTAE